MVLPLVVAGAVLASPLLFAQDEDDTANQKAMAAYKNGDYDSAIDNYTQAIASNPQDSKAYFQRAYLYVKVSEDDKAIADLTQAIGIDPRYKQAYYRRSFVYMIKGNYDEALADVNQAIEIAPEFTKAYYRRACIEMILGKDDLAIADLDKIIQMDPKFIQAPIRRSFAFMLKGDYAQALVALNQIIETNPNAAGTYNRLAWLLATCPEANFRDGRKAVENASKACDLTNWKLSPMLDTLAAACAESGDFVSAMKWENEAISLQQDPDKVDAQKSRLALYESYKPFHVEKYDPKFDAVVL
jgi:tetratricopeptide (TPR) repeat protein